MKTQTIGSIGESVAVEYLKRERYQILATNYLIKMAEIDIICSKADTVHFVEVKSVSHETREELTTAVTRETAYRPEDRVNWQKLRKLNRGVGHWLLKTDYKGQYQIDIAAVHLVINEKYAYIKLFEQVVIG